MKLMTSVFALLMCCSVFAQEKVLLESKNVVVNDTQAILVRTNKTPDKVKVTFSEVAMSNGVCERYETRYVTRTSGSYCGYFQTFRNVSERYCTRTNPRTGNCVNYAVRTRRVVQSYARTCPVPESYCAQYGTAVSYENDNVVIKFKNLPALGDSEEDTFQVVAKQKSYGGSNVVYDIKPLETVQDYEVKKTGIFSFLGVDRFVIKVK